MKIRRMGVPAQSLAMSALPLAPRRSAATADVRAIPPSIVMMRLPRCRKYARHLLGGAEGHACTFNPHEVVDVESRSQYLARAAPQQTGDLGDGDSATFGGCVRQPGRSKCLA